ncbi:hypothetical protein ACTXT7_012696 [Hymenolepis weldensis]
MYGLLFGQAAVELQQRGNSLRGGWADLVCGMRDNSLLIYHFPKQSFEEACTEAGEILMSLNLLCILKDLKRLIVDECA